MEIIGTDMETKDKDSLKYKKAEKRMKQLKGFYIHLVIYIVINTFISINRVIMHYYNNDDSWTEALWQTDTFSVWLFWGIGLAFHAAKTFNFNPFFSKDWEKRQIEKYMNEDKDEFRKL